MHQRTVSGLLIALLALSIALLQFLATTFFLYWVWWWFDIVMHFLGGVFIGSSMLWLIRYEVPVSIRHRIPIFLTTFLGVLAVGVLWEVFEYVTGLYAAVNYTLDTTLDLAMDIVGMLLAYLVLNRLFFQSDTKK